MKEKMKDLLLYGGATKQTYQNVRGDITEGNRRNVVAFSGIVAIGMLVMSFASFFDVSLIKNRPVYIVCAAICAVLCLTAWKPARNRPHLTYTAMYIFIGLMFAFGIDLGTFVEPNEVTVSFTVILFAAPLLFTDRPFRMILAILVGILVYLYAASLTQDPTMQAYNRSNVLPYGLISMVVSSYMMQIKISRHVLEAENKNLIETDRMTGLMNRRSYEKHIERLRRDGFRTGMKICAFDVNGLKTANDCIGHYAGDELIRGAADSIRRVFGLYGACYRTGGDEFVAILEPGAPDAEELGKRLAADCGEFRHAGIPALSLALGIVEPNEGDDVDTLVRQADQEMYKNKAEYYRKNGIERRK